MVRIFCAVSMVLAITMGMSACQDRNSRNDGMHEASDPAAPHDMNRNSQ
ncbi:hypothetical protein [Acinetobacter sp.]